MAGVLFSLALPFGVALALTALLRLIGGADTGGRLAGLAVPAGFLAAWGWSEGLTIHPGGVLGVASHIAFGGALAGLALDAAAAGRIWRVAVTLIFILVSTWAAFGMPMSLPLDPAARAALLVSAILLAACWTLVLERLSTFSPADRSREGVLLLAVLSLGVACVAAAAGAGGVAGPALGLFAAALGFAALAWPMGLPMGSAAILGGGGALLGLAQALAVVWPGTVVPLLILLLVPFAGHTAAQLPGGPTARPLWTGLLALMPALLAGVAALAMNS